VVLYIGIEYSMGDSIPSQFLSYKHLSVKSVSEKVGIGRISHRRGTLAPLAELRTRIHLSPITVDPARHVGVLRSRLAPQIAEESVKTYNFWSVFTSIPSPELKLGGTISGHMLSRTLA
jgi:hypothetical protein